jgi:hypothetical protein
MTKHTLSNDNIKCARCNTPTGSRYLVDHQFLCIECSPFYDLCNLSDPRRVWVAIKSFWAGRKTVDRQTQTGVKPRQFSTVKVKTKPLVKRTRKAKDLGTAIGR